MTPHERALVATIIDTCDGAAHCTQDQLLLKVQTIRGLLTAALDACTGTASPIPRAAINQLLDYNWKDEEHDYDSHLDEDGGNTLPDHIFTHMQAIDRWLEGAPRP